MLTQVPSLAKLSRGGDFVVLGVKRVGEGSFGGQTYIVSGLGEMTLKTLFRPLDPLIGAGPRKEFY